MSEVTSQVFPGRAAIMPEALPLLAFTEGAGAIAWRQGAPVSRGTFLAHVRHAAHSLADRRFVINLCEDRYLFLVAFAAIVAAGKTNLLPPGRISRQLRDAASAFPDHQTVTDAEIEPAIRAASAVPDDNPIVPSIAADHLAAIVFTSGSTGRSQAHLKHWGCLVEGARLAEARFGFHRGGPATVVVTVPAQHMYGLETSILVPLVCGIGVHSGQPFYPGDIHGALNGVGGRRILITTPMHLRICVESALSWPSVEFIVSATAPLSSELAERAERAFDCPVLEIYGCTEAGSIASRRTTAGTLWQTYDGLSIDRNGSLFEVRGGHLGGPIALNDWLILRNAAQFELAGRQADLVNVAGKRASLSDLTLKLHEIDGVTDGVFLTPPEDEDGRAPRLIALAVAPGLGEKQILKALAERIDRAFLPRPLYRVERLPRNSLGKLPRADLLALLRQLRQAKRDG